jgi:TolB-like protein
VRLSLSNRQALRRLEFDEETYRSRLVDALSTVVEPTVTSSAQDAKPAPKTDPPSIMILPFVCLSDDRELAFLAEGMAGNLIASMPVRMDLWKKVQGQASEAGLDPVEIGQRRSVRYILNGNLQKGGDTVRATVNLTETTAGQQIWAQRYDRSADNMLGVQDQLVASILDEMGPAVGAAEADYHRDIPDGDLDAWGLVNRAQEIQVVDRATRERLLSLLRRAVELDPNYGPAHAILSNSLTMLVQTLFTRHPDEFAADALKHADKAIELMPNQPWALTMCSTVHNIFGNEAYALRIAERASDILGQETRPLMIALIVNGRAAEVIERAKEWANPPYRLLYQSCVILGRNAEALEWAEKSVAEDPRDFLRWAELANVLGVLGRKEEALEAVSKAKAIVPTWTLALFEKGTRITTRNKDGQVEPQLAGLRMLGID